MAKQRMINTRFWTDNYIVELDPIEKLLFLYLLTNQSTNILGIYELPLRNMAFDTGIDKEMIEKVFSRFTKDKKIYYVDGWVCLKNFVKYQNTKSPFVVTGMNRELEEIPLEIKDKLKKIDRVYIGYIYQELKLKSKLSISKGISKSKDIDYSDKFLKFWEHYPNKKGKGKAFESWGKIKNPIPPLEEIIKSVNEHKKSDDWTDANGKYIQHPATWLNGRGWEDEVKICKPVEEIKINPI